eukprot:TRINITY_DN113686_c0_g1_i1.p1 TRINITY_DN113686_c0_g1~~TRINITY_DN113686_c0_g1_i1.p1  ORF type:complete len:372 (+),score=48.83 TRINITY_DN113686_c0_g1_i1:23-1117(+)
MARRCGALLRGCSSYPSCAQGLLPRLRMQFDCLREDDDGDDIPKLLKGLLKCYEQECPAGDLFQLRRSVLTPTEIAQVLACGPLAVEEGAQAGLDHASIQTHRSFGDYLQQSDDEDIPSHHEAPSGAGHTVTYIHRVLEQEAGHVLDKLRETASEAATSSSWRIAEALSHDGSAGSVLQEQLLPAALKLRSAELVTYNAGDSLQQSANGSLGVHIDGASLLTVVVALNSDEEFSGGALTFHSVCAHPTKMAKRAAGDVAIFPSWHWHSVAPVTAGIRRALVLEFWEFCSGPRRRRVGYPTEVEFSRRGCTYHNDDDPSVDSLWKRFWRSQALLHFVGMFTMPFILAMTLVFLDLGGKAIGKKHS